MRKSVREQLADAKRKTGGSRPPTDYAGFVELLLGGRVLPTQRRFIDSLEGMKAYKGPAGCAKTSTIAAAGLLRAIYQPGSKGLVGRRDYNDLAETTHLRFVEMVDRLPQGILLDRDKSPPEKWWIRSAATKHPDGSITEGEPSQITFMGLSDSLGGIELNWAVVDEADQCEETRIREVTSRFRNRGGNYSLMLAFNPPDKNHWLYTACTGRNGEEEEVSKPWLSLYEPLPDENTSNLPENYYQDLTARLTPDQARRLVLGEWGGTFEGQPVYREFSPAIHVKRGLTFDPSLPLLRGWDFGYVRPYCCWAQLSRKGHLRILHEKLGHNVHVRAFAQLVKAETSTRFPEAQKILDFGDPAVKQQKDTGQSLADLYKEGIQMRYRPSKIKEGKDLIHLHLNKLIEGEAAFQFDADKVPTLITALRGGYRMKPNGLEPLKDGFYDHPCLAPDSQVQTPSGTARIDTLAPGDLVVSASSDGPVQARVVACWQTAAKAKRFALTVNGQALVGTGNHPVLTQRGYVRLDGLRYGDRVVVYGPNRHSQDLPAVQRPEVLPDESRLLLLRSRLQQERAAAPSSHAFSSGQNSTPYGGASQEREQIGQPLGELGAEDPLRSQPRAHDSGAQEEVSGNDREVCGPGCEGVARLGRRAGMACEAQQEELENSKALREALSHVFGYLQNQGSSPSEVLSLELQDGGFQATESWVLEEVHEGPVWALTVEPTHNYVAAGVVTGNCDGFRYLVLNVINGITHFTYEGTNNISYSEHADPTVTVARLPNGQRFNLPGNLSSEE